MLPSRRNEVIQAETFTLPINLIPVGTTVDATEVRTLQEIFKVRHSTCVEAMVG